MIQFKNREQMPPIGAVNLSDKYKAEDVPAKPANPIQLYNLVKHFQERGYNASFKTSL